MTVGETISGDGQVLAPFVVLPGALHLTGWFNNNIDETATFGVSETGFMNDELTLQWLEHFDARSAVRQVGQYRLLLQDNFGSYCTMEFLDYSEKRKIINYFLPPYTTHFLQPLDVGVF